MSDLISRQAVLDSLYALCDTGETLKENPWRDNPHIDAITDAIDALPSAENTAKWVSKDISDLVYCSKCDYREWYTYATDYNYCPNCGARMKGGAE